MDKKLLCLLVLVVVVGVYYLYYVRRHPNNEGYDGYLRRRDLPTSPEVESIEGTSNFDVVGPDGTQVIHEGDIALGPGFGIGEGTVGFGRYGSSFMA